MRSGAKTHIDMENVSVKTIGLIVLVFAFTLGSCQWEDAVQPAAAVPQQSMDHGGSGNTGDDEEPIIQGVVTNAQMSTINSAQVSLIDQSTLQVVAQTQSDALGLYSLSAQAGNYRMEVSATGYQAWALDSLALDTLIVQPVILQ